MSAVREPLNIARLRHDSVGRPVPWFVHWNGDTPDFRVVAPGRVETAIAHGLCWTCGQPLDARPSFLIGPMCAVNRTSAEPPSHLTCVRYSAQVCPFLTNPNRERREAGMPEGGHVPGVQIKRNPGVTLVWMTEGWQPFSDGEGGTLIDVGAPRKVEWWAEGRTATRSEVVASIESGLPLLADMAAEEGPEAEAELARLVDAAMALVPA